MFVCLCLCVCVCLCRLKLSCHERTPCREGVGSWRGGAQGRTRRGAGRGGDGEGREGKGRGAGREGGVERGREVLTAFSFHSFLS